MFNRLLLPLVVACCAALAPAGDEPVLVPFVQQFDAISPSARPGEELGAQCKRLPVGPSSPDAGIELTADGADPEGAARYTCAPIASAKPFRDMLVSWNVDCPAQAGFVVELRVATDSQSAWSPWMHVGEWGQVPAGPRTMACEGGKIDTDFFRGERSFERAQLRVSAVAKPAGTARRIVIRNLSCCASDPKLRVPYEPRIPPALRSSPVKAEKSAEAWKRRIAVPFRSQRAEDDSIAGRICSPTSVAMVMAHQGVERATREVADRAWDPVNEIYGNWPWNVQAAYSFGVPGYLTRFACWPDIELAIASGQPIIASIAVKEGQLNGAPYKKTAGHLLVVTGFDENGDVCVNDPAARDAKSGQTVYKRSEMQTVWLDRGGTSYVLLPKP